ncbi:hypothetical protein BMS3Bbin09_01835 [bacterium BMS3Bbin09]|nr:hypothetical protein BMS3Bbin09_01835 [bacterium BMS3Bbin09]
MDFFQDIINFIDGLSAKQISFIALGVSLISLFLGISKFRLSATEKETAMTMLL